MKQILKSVYIIIWVVLFSACSAIAPRQNNLATLVPFATKAITVTPIPLSVTSVNTLNLSTMTPTKIAHVFQLEGLGARSAPQYSPDGKWLILPTVSGVFVLATTSYQDGRLLTSFTDYFGTVAISPAGKLVVFENNLMAVNDGYELPDIQIPLNTINGSLIREAEFSPDSRLLAVIYEGIGKQIDIWNMVNSKFLYTLPAESIEFSPNGNLIAVVMNSEEISHIQLYEAQTGNPLKDWIGERVVFLPDNRLALEMNGAIRIYDPSTGKVPNVFNGRFPAFSPDGSFIALLYYDRIEIHRITDGKLIHKLQGDFEDVYSFNLRFAPNGQTLVGYAYWRYCCAGDGGKLSLWRVKDGALIKDVPFIGSFNFSPDSSSLAVASSNGLQIWNTLDGSVRANLKKITIP